MPVLGARRRGARGAVRIRAVDLTRRAAVVSELLRLREKLEGAAPGEDDRALRTRYHRLLNESGAE